MCLKNKIFILTIVVMFCSWVSCSNNNNEPAQTISESIELRDYDKIVSYEDNIIGSPRVIRHDGDNGLFVYDSGSVRVIKIDDNNGSVLGEYGMEGRGPGEFIRVSNIYTGNNLLYIVDSAQFLIHKYDLDSRFLSSFSFAPPMNQLPPPPPMPPIPSEQDNFLESVNRYNFDNQTHVTLNGNVMLFNAPESSALYELKDWQENTLNTIGEIPEGSSFEADFSEYRHSITNKETPAVSKPNTFLVNDNANPEEYFLIYSAIPKIAKYHVTGEKLWEKSIPVNPETESIENVFFDTADHILGMVDMIIPLKKYWFGVSNQDGELFLATYNFAVNDKMLMIHHFSRDGSLQDRYELVSDVVLLPVFDLDQSARKLFIATEEAGIRAYSF